MKKRVCLAVILIFILGLRGVTLAAPPPPPATDAALKAAAEAINAKVVETRRDLHRHPELSNREERTGKLVAERLRALGLDEVRYPVAKTGVVGVLRGGRPGRVVALRADMDALPIQEKPDTAYKSENPGVMHACGHDAHTAMLLGAAEVLVKMKARIPGTVVFLFQPAEEGAPEGEEGGAPLMVKEGALDTPKAEAIFGLHVALGVDVGQIGWTEGPIMASADTFVVEVLGKTVHGALPHLGLDPIPVAAEMVSALQLIASRQVDAQEPKVLTIGQIHGGTRFNVIADKVVMEGTLRTFSPTVRADVKSRMARVVDSVAKAHGTTASLRFRLPGNDATINEGALARNSRPVVERIFGVDNVKTIRPLMVAEDFSVYGAKIPSLLLILGTRNTAKGIASVNHTEDFDIDEAALPLGVRTLAGLAWSYLSSSAVPPISR
jgi:amidohydrolase